MSHIATIKTRRTQRIIYDAFVKAALASDACPRNSDVCTLVGSSTVSTSAHAIGRMAKTGRLGVTHCNNGRENHIVEHGVSIVSKMRALIVKRETQAAATPRAAARVDPLPITVSRDPCFRCGVRGDIGCEHTPEWAQPLTQEA